MANGNETAQGPAYQWDDVLHNEYVQQKMMLALLILALSVAVGYLVRFSLTVYAKRVASKTRTQVDDFIMAAVHPPAVLIALTLGFWLAFREASEVLPFFFGTEILFFTAMVMLIAYTVGRIIKAALVYAGERKPNFRSITSLGSRLGYILAFAIGFMILLGALNIEITPLLTSLGIAGLAVALALQDTLSNLFAGLWIQTSRVVRPGDYIRIEDINQEGWVVEVSWRTTRIRTRPNHIVAIPNTKMANSVVSNFEMPQTEQAAVLEVGVAYGSDPEKVERILTDVGSMALKDLPQVVKTFQPIVRFGGFGDSALNFLLIVRVNHYIDQYLVLHELRKRTFKAFAEAGVEIPFPHRTVYLRQEGQQAALRLAVDGNGDRSQGTAADPSGKPYQGAPE